MMRKALADHFEDKPVGMGGVFAIKRGKAKLHVMVSLFFLSNSQTILIKGM